MPYLSWRMLCHGLLRLVKYLSVGNLATTLVHMIQTYLNRRGEALGMHVSPAVLEGFNLIIYSIVKLGRIIHRFTYPVILDTLFHVYFTCDT